MRHGPRWDPKGLTEVVVRGNRKTLEQDTEFRTRFLETHSLTADEVRVLDRYTVATGPEPRNPLWTEEIPDRRRPGLGSRFVRLSSFTDDITRGRHWFGVDDYRNEWHGVVGLGRLVRDLRKESEPLYEKVYAWFLPVLHRLMLATRELSRDAPVRRPIVPHEETEESIWAERAFSDIRLPRVMNERLWCSFGQQGFLSPEELVAGQAETDAAGEADRPPGPTP